ncbi:MAG: cupredoxin domain-containing protein [Candidatus Paceibacterota bacterium]|jgi:plastocyanin domain-containing protein
MTPDKIAIVIGGIVVIGAVYKFFLGKKNEQAVSATSGAIEIKVDGGYTPEVVKIPLDKTTTLDFTRTDPTSCLEEVVLGDFNVRKTLPLNQKVSIEITPKKKGTFVYSCGMNMYKGKIIVE